MSNKIKWILIVILSAVVVFLIFIPKPPNDSPEKMTSFVTPPQSQDKPIDSSPSNTPTDIQKPLPKKPEILQQMREEISSKIDSLNATLASCQKEVDAKASENFIMGLEARVWELADNSPERLKVHREVKNVLSTKVDELLKLNWQSDQVADISRQIMQEDIALSDPAWTLETGGKIRPCGLYNVHRLFSLWIEVTPENPQGEDLDNALALKEKLLQYTKMQLPHAVGAAGVAMMVELMSGLSQKGLLPSAFKDRVSELENKLNDEMDLKFDGVQDSNSDLVRSILSDYNEAESSRIEYQDMMKQFSL